MSRDLGGDSPAVGSMGEGVGAPARAAIADRTLRTDRWWLQPAITFTLLVIWLLYALVRTASQRAYFVEEYHYLSPFSSPCVSSSCIPAARDFGTWFGDFPPFVPFALLVLLLPQGLLPGVLALAAGLRGGRAAREVHR